VVVGGKLHRRGGKGNFPYELYINMPAGEGMCSDTSSCVLGKEKPCNSGGCAQKNSK
jgi:hypothetical protein